jgi:hypothetical protein
MYEHSSLIQKILNYGQKRFITMTPGANVIKLFARDSRIFILS